LPNKDVQRKPGGQSVENSHLENLLKLEGRVLVDKTRDGSIQEENYLVKKQLP
jgi:hypothetical protein